jgi:predicted nucleotidyltransferase
MVKYRFHMIDRVQQIKPEAYNRIALRNPRAAAQIVASVLLPKVLKENLFEKIIHVFHFGSTARGDFDQIHRSDIDLAIVLTNDVQTSRVMAVRKQLKNLLENIILVPDLCIL